MPGKGLARAGALALVAISLGGAVLVIAPAASAFVYWADTQHQTIGRASNDGSGVDDAFVHTGALPFAVAVDSSHIYWANQNSNSIGRANIDGSAVNNEFIAGVSQPSGVAVNGSSIFWATLPGPIGRANLDGSEKKPSFITAASQPCGLALDSGHVYWADESLGTSHIGRASLDGGFPQPEYVNLGVSFPCGVAVNSANIFWADTGFLGGGNRLGRANTSNGGGVDLSFISGAETPCGVALDGSSHLYWANAEAGTIGRANADGTAVNQSFVATGGSSPCGVAVDSLAPSPPNLAPQSQPASPATDTSPPQTTIVKGPGKALAKGVAEFRFRSSEAGSSFTCKLDKRKPKPCRSPKTYTRLKSGRHVFKVWAADSAGNKDPTSATRRFRVPAT